MAGLINELISILNAQVIHYDELLILSKEKKGIIIKNDTEFLRKLTIVENKIIGKIQKLENRRLGLMKDIATVLNKSPDTLTLGKLLEIMKDQNDYADLLTVKQKLRETLEELKNTNDLNNELLQSSIDYINFSINLVRNSVAAETSYHSQKSNGFYERGFFDVRQ